MKYKLKLVREESTLLKRSGMEYSLRLSWNMFIITTFTIMVTIITFTIIIITIITMILPEHKTHRRSLSQPVSLCSRSRSAFASRSSSHFWWLLSPMIIMIIIMMVVHKPSVQCNHHHENQTWLPRCQLWSLATGGVEGWFSKSTWSTMMMMMMNAKGST